MASSDMTEKEIIAAAKVSNDSKAFAPQPKYFQASTVQDPRDAAQEIWSPEMRKPAALASTLKK